MSQGWARFWNGAEDPVRAFWPGLRSWVRTLLCIGGSCRRIALGCLARLTQWTRSSATAPCTAATASCSGGASPAVLSPQTSPVGAHTGRRQLSVIVKMCVTCGRALTCRPGPPGQTPHSSDRAPWKYRDDAGSHPKYAAASRLTSEEWLDSGDQGLYSFSYEFDASGNRALLTKNGLTTYYEYNSLNQLALTETTEGALTYYTYQADGAVETKHDASGWTYYTWDVDESLTDIAAGDSDLSGAYDADMKRVSRDEDDAATGFVFDGEKLLRSVPASGATTHFVSEGDSVYSPLIGSMQVNGGGTGAWHLFDALGTTIGLSDADGALTDTRLYDAFGNLLGSTGSATTPFEYVGAYGYYNEPDVDFMLLWHRWYEQGVGRFGSHDRFWGTAGQRYTYALGAPAALVDASGDFVHIPLIGVCVVMVVGGLLVGTTGCDKKTPAPPRAPAPAPAPVRCPGQTPCMEPLPGENDVAYMQRCPEDPDPLGDRDTWRNRCTDACTTCDLVANAAICHLWCLDGHRWNPGATVPPRM